ncbi:Conserved_hypothetical protein [Hexamita inflata]|uniref:Partial n=1 Tax=Hexamita inflata TaxID=28002 RepID=A0ABP1IKJ6_9EUKA
MWRNQPKQAVSSENMIDSRQTIVTKDYTYIGDMVNGLKSGFGSIIYRDNSVYSGNFIEDQFSGRGTFIYENGAVLNGTFSEGELVHGTVTFKDQTNQITGNIWRHIFGHTIVQNSKQQIQEEQIVNMKKCLTNIESQVQQMTNKFQKVNDTISHMQESLNQIQVHEISQQVIIQKITSLEENNQKLTKYFSTTSAPEAETIVQDVVANSVVNQKADKLEETKAETTTKDKPQGMLFSDEEEKIQEKDAPTNEKPAYNNLFSDVEEIIDDKVEEKEKETKSETKPNNFGFNFNPKKNQIVNTDGMPLPTFKKNQTTESKPYIVSSPKKIQLQIQQTKTEPIVDLAKKEEPKKFGDIAFKPKAEVQKTEMTEETKQDLIKNKPFLQEISKPKAVKLQENTELEDIFGTKGKSEDKQEPQITKTNFGATTQLNADKQKEQTSDTGFPKYTFGAPQNKTDLPNDQKPTGFGVQNDQKAQVDAKKPTGFNFGNAGLANTDESKKESQVEVNAKKPTGFNYFGFAKVEIVQNQTNLMEDNKKLKPQLLKKVPDNFQPEIKKENISPKKEAEKSEPALPFIDDYVNGMDDVL